jgi:hypothetical protein
MKLPIGHRLTLSGYEVEVVEQGSCYECAFLENGCLCSCSNIVEYDKGFKLIKDLRPDRSE